MVKKPKFSIHGWKGQDGKFYFHIRSANSMIVMQSEGYTEKRGAERLLTSLQADGHFKDLKIQWEVV